MSAERSATNEAGFGRRPLKPTSASLQTAATRHIPLKTTLIFIAAMLAGIGAFAADILPKGWLSPEQLEQAEHPIQRQLDTGVAMGPTAWDMAAVKDARLLLLYVQLYERLADEPSRRKLLSEQEAWLQRRRKAVSALADPQGGSMVTLDQASKHMDITDERIAELQKRVEQLNTDERKAPAKGASSVIPPAKASPAEAAKRRVLRQADDNQ